MKKILTILALAFATATVANAQIGIIGGFVGSWVFNLIGIHWSGILGAIGTSAIGACILIIVGKVLFK